ncbi:DUF2829 domain-containing protein [Levilactobacillus wangkuiensis]|uniref:DUF2829 domain-containing protein n=1 Tax=Levilactobacillus wangkuiensis TaxID=2799566 RepID=UPI00194F1243|nr:DUF2829 domain-containing protein [Levilactobacillus wangkuiensis]
MTFGEAIEALKAGEQLKRKGWNGKGIFIALMPGNSFEDCGGHKCMTHDYIYIDTTGLQTTNDSAPLDRLPWLASQTDMLADDWEVVQ